MIYLKKAARTAETDQQGVHEIVAIMLAEIAAGGEVVARNFARYLNQWAGDIIVSSADRAAAAAQVPDRLKADIQFAHDNVRRFAQAQRAKITDCTIEILPGVMAGASTKGTSDSHKTSAPEFHDATRCPPPISFSLSRGGGSPTARIGLGTSPDRRGCAARTLSGSGTGTASISRRV